MSQTVCATCGISQGPFDKRATGLPLCKDIEGCSKRRNKIDFDRYGSKDQSDKPLDT